MNRANSSFATGAHLILVFIVQLVLFSIGSYSHAEDVSPPQHKGGTHSPDTLKTFVMASKDQFRPTSPTQNILSRQGKQQRLTLFNRMMPKEHLSNRESRFLTDPWTEILLKKIAQYDLSPVRAARAIALLHVAMSDATVASWDAKYADDLFTPAQGIVKFDPAITVQEIPSYPSEHAAVAEAAATVLSYLFPFDAKEFRRRALEAAESRINAGTHSLIDIEAGQTIGSQVGSLVVHRGKTDGSDQMYSVRIPAGPGFWTLQSGMMADPTAGSWRPWILKASLDVALPPPPAPGSFEFQADINELVSSARDLTNEQRSIANYWADGPGTATPAGHWIKIAEKQVMHVFGNDPPRAAQALALVSISMADAFIVCWDAKYKYWTARPNQVVPGFASYLKTPSFPGYPSGHSTVSGAASEVLAYLFPQHATKFRAMAEEAARSRLYGGIHFSSDNNNGLQVGREIGRRVVDYISQVDLVIHNTLHHMNVISQATDPS
jgi:membrane-associated phospholipid phosphatase